MASEPWHELVQIMKRWIEEDIEDIPPLPALSERLGYSQFYATRKFHEIEGVSFREYVTGRKIMRAAADLYLTTERTIDIAMKYGYSSQEAFARAFAKVYGVTPGAYRRMPKPTPSAEKDELLRYRGPSAPIEIKGGRKMQLSVKQMYDWNCYAFVAEDVDEKYWEYFRSGLWWQLGSSFIKSYDNVQDFAYCAENFAKYGEVSIKQQLKLLPTPWETALELFIAEVNKLGVDWYIHGSVAMALWGIDVVPKDINVIFANYSDFDKVRAHLCKLAIGPIERCDNWVMSGLGQLFMEATIGIAFHNRELEPFDMSRLGKVEYRGMPVHLSTLEMLRQDNEGYDRPEMVRLIEKRSGHVMR